MLHFGPERTQLHKNPKNSQVRQNSVTNPPLPHPLDPQNLQKHQPRSTARQNTRITRHRTLASVHPTHRRNSLYIQVMS